MKSKKTFEVEDNTQRTEPTPPCGPQSGLEPTSGPFTAALVDQTSNCEEGDSEEPFMQVGRDDDVNPLAYKLLYITLVMLKKKINYVIRLF